MKIQCDVCGKEEASVFCAADEAALCSSCDRRVHHANKLAGKHLRFSLLQPDFKESPRCDVCQERRGFLFCQEDRAILCRECDIPIHKSNEHTQKHSRYLLTGVKLSPPLSSTSSSSSSSSSSLPSSSSSCPASSSSNDNSGIKSSFFSNQFSSSHPTISSNHHQNQCPFQDHSPMSASSISEYLMETLPGWRVDDFLDPSSHGFCKTSDVESLLSDQAFDNNLYNLFENSAIWVLQPPSQSSNHADKLMKSSRKICEDGFRVPLIRHSPKKSRNSW